MQPSNFYHILVMVTNSCMTVLKIKHENGTTRTSLEKYSNIMEHCFFGKNIFDGDTVI